MKTSVLLSTPGVLIKALCFPLNEPDVRPSSAALTLNTWPDPLSVTFKGFYLKTPFISYSLFWIVLPGLSLIRFYEAVQTSSSVPPGKCRLISFLLWRRSTLINVRLWMNELSWDESSVVNWLHDVWLVSLSLDERSSFFSLLLYKRQWELNSPDWGFSSHFRHRHRKEQMKTSEETTQSQKNVTWTLGFS